MGEFVSKDKGDSSGAVILSDCGSIHFIGNEKGWFSYVYERHTRIRIDDQKAVRLATAIIPLRSRNDEWEKVDNVEASTYNLEKGVVTETKLGKNDIFEDRKGKYYKEVKFTAPAVREGSIFEISYAITSDFIVVLPRWDFQSIYYPCLSSEYEVEIPQAMFYTVVRHGIHAFDVDKGSAGGMSYRVKTPVDAKTLVPISQDLTVTAATIKHRWVMKNIPAFHDESYISTPRNYLDRIELQLSKTYNGEETRDFMNTWRAATEELLSRSDFGLPLSEENTWMEDWLKKITGGIDDGLAQAKAIYYYLQEHLTCTNDNDIHIRTGLWDVLKRNSGSVGDLNLLLVAMLRQKGFTADPVVLSTRDKGYSLAKFPVLDNLNYVIARLSLGSVVYYLDIAHPQLAFGQLDDNCYNGHARIISIKDSGSVYFEADSLHEKRTTMVFVSSGAEGMEGSYLSNPDLPTSYHIRSRIADIGEKEYFRRLQTAYGDDAVLKDMHIDSLDRKEDPIAIRYEFQLKHMTGGSLIYFNPFFGDGLRENPFRAAERKYPVEMSHTSDDIYLFNLEIPQGYAVEEIPRSTKVAFNGDQGFFEYLIEKQDNTIQLRCRLKLDRAYFGADDYANLRDFFAYVVKKENEQIVLKKTITP